MYMQKKSIKFHYVVMMIRDYEHIHMEQMLLKYGKVKC